MKHSTTVSTISIMFHVHSIINFFCSFFEILTRIFKQTSRFKTTTLQHNLHIRQSKFIMSLNNLESGGQNAEQIIRYMQFNSEDWLDLSFVHLKVGSITTEYTKSNFEDTERTGKASKIMIQYPPNEFYLCSSKNLCDTWKVP